MSIKQKDLQIVGFGGSGTKIINALKDTNANYDCLVISADKKDIEDSKADKKIFLEEANGYGFGLDTNSAQIVFDKNKERILKELDLTKKQILISGLGGACSSIGISYVANMLAELKINFSMIASLPFQFEGKTRTRIAVNTLNTLLSMEQKLYFVNNDECSLPKNITLGESFNLSNEMFILEIKKCNF